MCITSQIVNDIIYFRMSENRESYTVLNPPSQEITGKRFRVIPLDLNEYTSVKALAKAHGIPIIRLHRLLISVGLHYVTSEQIIQTRDARAKVLRETWKPRPRK